MYALTLHPFIIRRTSDNAFIPADERNSDYRAYTAWVNQGNTPDPAPEEA